MWKDPIVDEVRKVREEYSREFGHDLTKIVADLQRRERESMDRGAVFQKLPPKASGVPAPQPKVKKQPSAKPAKAAKAAASKAPAAKRSSPKATLARSVTPRPKSNRTAPKRA